MAEENQYLDLLRDVMTNGDRKLDRTNVGTRAVFGRTMRFSLRNGTMPLLTTKRVFWRGVVAELLWFIGGFTSSHLLRDQGVHIWDKNGSREFLDSVGLTDRDEGDLGPIYGFQWRHFGASYHTMHQDYTNQGIDQLANLIQGIKQDPDSRRHILTAWNPSAIQQMALPPCHIFAQFYVSNGELSCQMYQRSADMGLGVPFNIASYSLLTHLIATVCGLKAGEFIHVIGDCHVYETHMAALEEQLMRTPRPFPSLHIKPKADIDAFEGDDIQLVGYDPYPSIKMEMAV